MAGLLGAEQVAGAADLEVAHRDREPCAELGVVGERRQPRPRLRRQLVRVGIEEVRVREDVAAADAAADLVELAQAEHVGPLDDQRVRLRDVEARLDDRRRDEHVRVAGEERDHLLLQLVLAHLTVRDEEAQARAELLQLLRPPPRSSRRGCGGRTPGRRVRPRARAPCAMSSSSYSPTKVRIGRRPSGGVSITEMSRSPESDMCSVRGIGVALIASTSTSSRSWRSSSFCATPKRCSSSTITSPSSFGIDVAREDAVRADQHLDLSFGKVEQRLLRLLRRPEARDHLDADGEVAVAVLERVPVLLREHRRRHEHQHLLAADGDGERGAQRDLGLAEADVAADEPVHRMRRLEILLDRLDRRALVLGLAVRELALEPLDPLVLDVVGDARAGSGAARRAAAARPPARAGARGRASSGCPTPCRRASRASAPSSRRRCSG